MAKCRVFAIDDNLKEVVPQGLYSKHLFGMAVSVSVVKFVTPQGPQVHAKSHAHGEEASLQIKGACSVFVGAGTNPGDPEYPMAQGAAMLIPAPSQQTPGHPAQAYMAVDAMEPTALPIE